MRVNGEQESKRATFHNRAVLEVCRHQLAVPSAADMAGTPGDLHAWDKVRF